MQKYQVCTSPYLEFVVFGFGSAVKWSVVLKARHVIAQMELLDLLRHLVPANRHHRRQQAEVNYRPHAANLKNKIFYSYTRFRLLLSEDISLGYLRLGPFLVA